MGTSGHPRRTDQPRPRFVSGARLEHPDSRGARSGTATQRTDLATVLSSAGRQHVRVRVLTCRHGVLAPAHLSSNWRSGALGTRACEVSISQAPDTRSAVVTPSSAWRRWPAIESSWL